MILFLITCQVHRDDRLEKERFEEVGCVADHDQDHRWQVDRQDRPEQPSSESDGDAQDLDVVNHCLPDHVLLDVVLGQLLRPSIFEVPWREGNQLLSSAAKFQNHEAGLHVERVPPHVVVAEELDVVDAAHADLVLRALVDVDVLADARITSNAFAHATYRCERFIVVCCSLTPLCVGKNNYRQPYLVELFERDYVHGFVLFDVVEVKPCVHPCHPKTEFQLEDLLDFFDFLDHQYLQTEVKNDWYIIETIEKHRNT